VQYLIAIRGRFLSLAENKGVSSAVSLGVFSFVVNFDPGAAIAGTSSLKLAGCFVGRERSYGEK
jgi:hypothetical protein